MKELGARELGRPCDPTQFAWRTTDDVADTEEVPGQDRASEAMRFGLGIQQEGYNLFVVGPVGSGRHHLVRERVTSRAAVGRVPEDQVYVHAFDDPARPNAVRLPPGEGAKLRRDMQRLVDDLPAVLEAAFETDDHRTRAEAIRGAFQQRQEQALDAVRAFAEGIGIALLRTPNGLVVAPVEEGQVIPPERLEALPKERQEAILAALVQVKEKLAEVARQMPRWEGELRTALRELDQQTTAWAVAHQMEQLQERWGGHDELGPFLAEVGRDIVENAHRLRGGAAAGGGGLEAMLGGGDDAGRRYLVNVLVDRTGEHGAPVVFEDDPTLPALVGRVEHRVVFGALRTDHTLIRPGALHRANGGYLVLDALRVLARPLAWEHLKRALRSGEIRFGTLQDWTGSATTSLDPEPIPLDLKVILIGDRSTWHLMSTWDPEFALLFKVTVDLEDTAARVAGGDQAFAAMIATFARQDRLRPFTREGVAAVIDESVRRAGDRDRLAVHLDGLTDLLREADHHAREAGEARVDGEHVRQALEAADRRGGRIRDLLLARTVDGTFHVPTEGAVVGQINGLSVMEIARTLFGRPSRITARVRLGAGQVLDIEREVELGGPIHSKGVLILTGYVGATYGGDRPLSVSASLVFEQSYGGVDGDSASLAETVVLLSALAELPLRQDLAVTGSIDQAGRVQAVGGVAEKVEGFFDLCAARGLTGSQGVILPATNARHLVLRDRVVQAVEAGTFHVWVAETVDDALELLTGLPAGVRGTAGWPADSVHGRVDARLAALAAKAAALGGKGS